jgi:hypothetical protein
MSKYKIGQVKRTLELVATKEALQFMDDLHIKSSKDEDDFLISMFYENICVDVRAVLSGLKKNSGDAIAGITVRQIGLALDKMGEPWPDNILAVAIQYKLFEDSCVFYTIDEIVKMKFKSL